MILRGSNIGVLDLSKCLFSGLLFQGSLVSERL